MEAKYDPETREFIEGVFKANNYTLERQLSYLEYMERQKYNYYCDRTAGNWGWTDAEEKKYQAEWNEILEMIRERKE